MASRPIGRLVRNTSLQLKYCKKIPNNAKPIRVPSRADTTMTEKALPLSLVSNTWARIALALPVISAPPSPTTPLHRIRVSKLLENADRTLATVIRIAPIKYTRA